MAMLEIFGSCISTASVTAISFLQARLALSSHAVVRGVAS